MKALLLACAVNALGCATSLAPPEQLADLSGSPVPDMWMPVFVEDLNWPDLEACPPTNVCNCDPACMNVHFGPPTIPFTLSTDASHPLQMDVGITRDPDGHLVLGGQGSGGVTPYYRVIIPGCFDGAGRPLPTTWHLLRWSAVQIKGQAEIGVLAWTGVSIGPAAWAWGQLNRLPGVSPVDLESGILMPNGLRGDDAYLQLDFVFTTNSVNKTPVLDDFDVAFKCPPTP